MKNYHHSILFLSYEVLPGLGAKTLSEMFCARDCRTKVLIDPMQGRNKQRSHWHDQCPFKSSRDHRVVYAENQEIQGASQRCHDENRTGKSCHHHLPTPVRETNTDHYRMQPWLIITNGGIRSKDQANMPEEHGKEQKSGRGKRRPIPATRLLTNHPLQRCEQTPKEHRRHAV